MYYFIIEHPSRGTLTVESEVGNPRFAVSGTRDDIENMRSYTLREAKETLETYTNETTKERCYILRSPGPDGNWQKVA